MGKKFDQAVFTFTFYYIYIKTLCILCILFPLLYLHSIIFILKPSFLLSFSIILFLFTFYYIYIKTDMKDIQMPWWCSFTFYYIYIKTFLN